MSTPKDPSPTREQVAALLALQGYRLGSAEQAAVHLQFGRLAAIAAPLLAATVPPEIEAAMAPILRVPAPPVEDAP